MTRRARMPDNDRVARRILIVDDHAGFRAAARRLLEADSYDVVGEAPDGESALTAARSLEPDVVLLDIQLPGIDGFEVAAQIAQDDDPPAVVLVSTLDTNDVESRLDPGHVRGFLPKDRLSGPALDALLAD
jgi:DNA-binding NarL/FixJ family response regulator